MMKRFLLDWIDAKPARSPVRRQHELVAFARADKAHSPLPVMELAGPRAKVALHPAVFEMVPVSRWK
jgi:hypothetical protein